MYGPVLLLIDGGQFYSAYTHDMRFHCCLVRAGRLELRNFGLNCLDTSNRIFHGSRHLLLASRSYKTWGEREGQKYNDVIQRVDIPWIMTSALSFV